MKLVAAARLNRAQERIVSARPFAEKLDALLGQLAYLARRQNADLAHPLLARFESNRIDLVLVTADRGLCGGFNANLLRRTMQFLRENKDRDVRLWLVGRKGRDFFRRFYGKIEKEYIGIFQRLGYAQAEVIGQDLIQSYLKGETSAVHVLYNEFKSRIQQKLTVRELLPIADVPETAPTFDFIYEPSRDSLLEELLPRFVKSQVYRILLESQAAELAARMSAMESATNNARDLIHSLTLTMNKVRQAGITKEISEIVGGAEALQN
jgi:F-type H+-transporting ATPase subunit gamma